jgi:histone deacetylase 1/2
MTQFHSDEYIDFLNRITPSNMNNFIKEQHKCQFSIGFECSALRLQSPNR